MSSENDYPPQVGTWTLTAPDGRFWQGVSPIACTRAERNERVPATVQLARIMATVNEPDIAERHVQVAKTYGVTKADDLIDALLVEVERRTFMTPERAASVRAWVRQLENGESK